MDADLTSYEVAALRRAFDIFDEDKDGNITAKEFLVVVRFFYDNLTEDELKSLIDDNVENYIDFTEFLSLMTSMIQNQAYDLQPASIGLRIFGRSENAYMTVNELREVITTLGENIDDKELTDIINDSIFICDGKFEMKEFFKIMHELDN